MSTLSDFQIEGKNAAALFTLKLHRGDGMLLLAMNWKDNKKPPKDFVGFAIEYKEPGGDRFFPLKNRLAFTGANGRINPARLSTMYSPIQKFRWVHFPRNAELKGYFNYRVTPVFMNNQDELSYGEPQEAKIQLMRETYPGLLNIAYTRGYVASQSFTEKYVQDKDSMKTLLPARSSDGVKFKCTHPKSDEALTWMGFEARSVLIELLDKAIKDKSATVDVVAYDLCERVFIEKLKALGSRLRIIIDDAGEHGEHDSGETQGEKILVKSAGRANVIRQHMGQLQHNKMIVINGEKIKAAVGGSTNFSWRGFFVQNNNALIVYGKDAIKPFQEAFKNYWDNKKNTTAGFGETKSAVLNRVKVPGVDIQVTFSPHSGDNVMLQTIAKDVAKAKSSLLFSLAFLYQTQGALKETFLAMGKKNKIFSYGMSDKKDGKFNFLKPDGKMTVVNPGTLTKQTVPEPFKSESIGGNGVRLHHKFVVIDFDTPDARVYLGSYNFSGTADEKNGENLFVIKDRKIATSYMIEAIRIFDHYQFRIAQADAKRARKELKLAKPPRKSGEETWFDEDYRDARKKKDRELFS
jgi:phosphatidylserine/phosphatidylglycerophosphate/cardiolipin synthase-like enzyme